MIGDYGKDPKAKIQSFEAVAILRPKTAKRAWAEDKKIDTVTVHTDGVMLSTEEDLAERRTDFLPAFRLIEGKKYRITVEELP